MSAEWQAELTPGAGQPQPALAGLQIRQSHAGWLALAALGHRSARAESLQSAVTSDR